MGITTKSSLVLALLVAGLVACGPEELNSGRLDREITIDGDFADWQGALQYVEDAGLSVGLLNDDNFLYIALVVGDRQVRRQITMSGMYLWFDAEEGENRKFGIRFPLGVVEGTDSLMALLRERDPNKMNEIFNESCREMMVIGEDDRTWRRGGTGEFYGISAAANAGRDALVAEFKIPLKKTAQLGYGIGAGGGDVVAVGLESKEIDMGDMREQFQRGMGGGPPGGGPPGGGREGGTPVGGGMGGGGMPGGGRGGPGGGNRREPPEPIKVWTRVVLAAGG